MIENLNGTHETVNYRTDMQICLHYNTSGEYFPPHWHTPFEVIMPVENTYRVECGDKNFEMNEGDILVICPCVIHELFSPREGQRIIFQPSIAQIGLRDLGLITSIIHPAILITPETCPKIHGRIYRLMMDIYKEYSGNRPYSEVSIYAQFLEILLLIGRNHAESARQSFEAKHTKQVEYMEKFQYVCNYINEHFTEDLTLDQAAALAGFSKYHFTRLFRQYADTSFYKYLNQKRIDHAKSLLLNPELTVIEVALASGFSSLSAFLRMFKLLNHCTPTEFRTMYSGDANL